MDGSNIWLYIMIGVFVVLMIVMYFFSKKKNKNQQDSYTNMLNSLVKNGTTDKNTAQTVLLFSVNSSPAFVIFAVGEGMLFSKKIGLVIFLANLLSSVITLILVTRLSKNILLYKTKGENYERIYFQKQKVRYRFFDLHCRYYRLRYCRIPA